MRPGPGNSITDVFGVRVGQHQRLDAGWATGSTVVLVADGAAAAVDVRGGAPGTRETDLLDPSHLVGQVQAVLLTGGSAYGLAAADGVLRWLAERHRGFPVGAEPHQVVPIVPAAVLFDLRLGEWGQVPDAGFGYAACEAAGSEVAQGSIGAGAGAVAGGVKGGVGTASTRLGSGATVGALVVTNATGSVVDLHSGLPYAVEHELDGEFGLRPPVPVEVAAAARRLAGTRSAPLNTVLGVVATDAELTKAQCRRLAVAGHDGLARAVRPAHTLFDGDAVFALATGAWSGPGADPVGLNELAAAAAEAFARAVVHGVLAADSVAGVPAYRQLWPSAGT